MAIGESAAERGRRSSRAACPWSSGGLDRGRDARGVPPGLARRGRSCSRPRARAGTSSATTASAATASRPPRGPGRDGGRWRPRPARDGGRERRRATGATGCTGSRPLARRRSAATTDREPRPCARTDLCCCSRRGVPHGFRPRDGAVGGLGLGGAGVRREHLLVLPAPARVRGGRGRARGARVEASATGVSGDRLGFPLLAVSALLMIVAAASVLGDVACTGPRRWIDLGPDHVAAVGVREARARGVHARPCSRGSGRQRRRPHAPAAAARARGRAWSPGSASLQHDLGTTLIICGYGVPAAVRRGRRGIRYLVRRPASPAILWRARPDPRRAVPAHAALRVLAQPGGGPAGERVPADPGPRSRSDRVAARDRARGEPGEVGLPAERPLRLHLRGDRRGARDAGATAVLVAFGVLLYAGVQDRDAREGRFRRLLAAGIVAWIGLQAIINLGAVTGMLPITGVPLPLLSFGGTALVVTLVGVGMLASVAMAVPVPPRDGAGRGAPAPHAGRRAPDQVAGGVGGEGRDRRWRHGGSRVQCARPRRTTATGPRCRGDVHRVGEGPGGDARPGAGYPFQASAVTSAQTGCRARPSARSVRSRRASSGDAALIADGATSWSASAAT